MLNAKIAEVDSALEVLKVREIELVGFVDKLKLTETKLCYMEKKVEMLETIMIDNETKMQKLFSQFEKKAIGEVNEEVFNCDKCEFETKSEKLLNIHKKRKHPINTVCEICEKEFDSQKKLKMHKYTHSYTR